MKKCFVISPIGEPGSDIREQADDVFEFLIEPALREMKIEAIRGDRLDEPGLITTQIIKAILDYDLCIADVSGQNPNVLYELAIAQAAERPIVLIKRAGEPIPFNVKDYRLVEYDLKPRSIATGKWIPILRNQLQRVLASDYKPPRLLPAREHTKSPFTRLHAVICCKEVRARLVEANAEALAFYQLEALKEFSPAELVDRLSARMTKEDFEALKKDQLRAENEFAQQRYAAARVPIRFNIAHPDPRFRGKVFRPIMRDVNVGDGGHYAEIFYIEEENGRGPERAHREL
jgi:hypothetical protein